MCLYYDFNQYKCMTKFCCQCEIAVRDHSKRNSDFQGHDKTLPVEIAGQMHPSVILCKRFFCTVYFSTN